MYSPSWLRLYGWIGYLATRHAIRCSADLVRRIETRPACPPHAARKNSLDAQPDAA
jgi:hypothetical protein